MERETKSNAERRVDKGVAVIGILGGAAIAVIGTIATKDSLSSADINLLDSARAVLIALAGLSLTVNGGVVLAVSIAEDRENNKTSDQ